MVNFYNEDVDFPFSEKGSKAKLRNFINHLINNEDKKIGELNYIFCSDNYLLEMNKQYLNHNYYTDVITFDYSDFPMISGDIFISVDTVKTNAEEYASSFEHEMCRVIFHGVLHLCGYKDKQPEEEKLMREKEDYYLKKNSIS